MHKLLLLGLVIGLSGCMSPDLSELVATPDDAPGYGYSDIASAEFFRAMTNATTNPGAGDPHLAERNGIHPTAMYASELAADDRIISIALSFASHQAMDAWDPEPLCEDAAVLEHNDRIVLVLSVDGNDVSSIAGQLQERTGAADVCDPIKAWL